MRRDSYHHDTTFQIQGKNRRSGSSVNRWPTPYAYREDTDKKDQGWALLDEGSTPPVADEDGPTIMDATALAVDECSGAYKTLSK
jgi:hypothetical protein